MSHPFYYRPAPALPADAPAIEADLCIYGANAAGVVAAVAARKRGLSVALINPGWFVGGLTSGGLGFTDFGNQAAIGGLAREFYRRVGARYGVKEEWRFEPGVARSVFEEWLREAGVEVLHGRYLAGATTATGPDGERRIQEITTIGGLRVRAACFLDCSYEGDLLAAAGASYAVGREANAEFGERINGQQIHATHQFPAPISPYVVAGDPASGLLPGIEPEGDFFPGAGDRRVQAYNFRICLTKRTDIRVAFEKPAGYDRARYELLARVYATGWDQTFWKFDPVRNEKTDTNNHGAVSTDFIGENHAWPEASHEERERIFQAHVTYQKGFHWFLANDPAVPEPIRAKYAEWGLAGDEFAETGHWPNQLYVREARRMRGEAVITEAHCRSHATMPDAVGLGAYAMDSHNCRRLVLNGRVLNEGDVQEKLPRPYAIGYRTLLPKRAEVANLLVPVCLSATHIAFGSVRMEPVFMILAESAATAAALAIRDAKDGAPVVHSVDCAELRRELLAAGQILDWDPARPNPLSGN